MPKEKIGNELYQNLGKLFYAVAMADKKVVPKEVEKLKEDVRKYWLEVDAIEDEFGSDAAYQIEIVFDWLQNEEEESQFYFDEFVDFYKEHPSRFDPKIKELILKTADDIASSFAGRNKSELILLSKLESLLN
ncbi:hypothetical protein LCGC14_2075700 [marine sediment metagenome]